MSAKALLSLSASILLGAAVVAPNAAFAQFLPPPGPPPFAAPPPGLGAGGPPPGLGTSGPLPGGPPRFDSGAGGLHGLDRGGQANFRSVEARAAAYSANRYTRNSYTRYGYGYGYGHGYRDWRYAAAPAYAYGRSYASDDDCHYVSTYRGYDNRRVLVCHVD
jgi:hypothetical protein